LEIQMKVADRFDGSQRCVLEQLHARDQKERQAGYRTPASLKAVSTEVAEFLYSLALVSSAERIVEFGTSHGYSTIHLAAAAKGTGGHVVSADCLPSKTAAAEENLKRAGLIEYVTLETCDGTELLERHPGEIDLAFIDYDAADFLPALAPLKDRMARGAALFIDGGPEGYWEREGVRGLVSSLDGDGRFVYCFLPMTKLQLLSTKIRM